MSDAELIAFSKRVSDLERLLATETANRVMLESELSLTRMAMTTQVGVLQARVEEIDVSKEDETAYVPPQIIAEDPTFDLAQFPWRKVSFGKQMVRNAYNVNPQIIVYSGKVRYDGHGFFVVTQATVEIDGGSSGSPLWVWVQGNETSGFSIPSASAVEPETDTTMFKIPLYTVYRAGAGTEADPYRGVMQWIWHIGDIHLSSPLR